MTYPISRHPNGITSASGEWSFPVGSLHWLMHVYYRDTGKYTSVRSTFSAETLYRITSGSALLTEHQ